MKERPLIKLTKCKQKDTNHIFSSRILASKHIIPFFSNEC